MRQDVILPSDMRKNVLVVSKKLELLSILNKTYTAMVHYRMMLRKIKVPLKRIRNTS